MTNHPFAKKLVWYREPLIWQFAVLGFGSGLPLLLVFSSLSLWLKQAGIDKAQITFYAWAGLGYGFKFLWAPLIDQVVFPWLSRWRGQRRGWLLASQIGVMSAIIGMALTDPSQGGGALRMAFMAVALGFFSASQDIVVDGLRIDIAQAERQGWLSSAQVAGYRVAMVAAGAGVLKIVDYLANHAPVGEVITTANNYHYQHWQIAWVVMALLMLPPMLVGQMIGEPKLIEHQKNNESKNIQEQLRFVVGFLLAIGGFVAAFWLFDDVISLLANNAPANSAPLVKFLLGAGQLSMALLMAGLVFFALVRLGFVDKVLWLRSFRDPITVFLSRFHKQDAIIIILTIALYRISDVVMGTVANLFYADQGYSLSEIADYSKSFGVVMTVVGGFVGGYLCNRWKILPILLLGAMLAALSNLLFAWLATIGRDLTGLMLAIAADNLSAGLAATAFVAFLSSLTKRGYSASQYALFTSLMVLLPKLLSGYSGSMVNELGYSGFFISTALMGVPVILLVYVVMRRVSHDKITDTPSA